MYRLFERQCEIGIPNLERVHAAIGDKVIGVFVTGTDFGTQNDCFISPRAYRNLYMPLPFGTPDEVYNEGRDRIRIFGKGGGFVFNTIHNVQASIPVENLLAMYNAVRDFRSYPLS